jgi:hypothetical protein
MSQQRTGPEKAIVGKWRVEPERLQRPAFVFLVLVIGLAF